MRGPLRPHGRMFFAMQALLIISIFLGVEIASEILVVVWHDWRERGREFATPVLSMVLQSMSWAAGWFAYVDQDWRIVVASVVGSGVGCWLGIRRIKRTQKEEEEKWFSPN